MSCFSLWYRVMPKGVPPAIELPTQMKYMISQRFWGHDGSQRGEALLRPQDIPYLQGLEDGAQGKVAEGVRELIAVIREHGAVHLWIGDPQEIPWAGIKHARI